MFQDEAGFGRTNKPKYCWCVKGFHSCVLCHHIWKYRYAYGAVEPQTGKSFFLVLPHCITDCMNVFLQELSKAYPNSFILMVADCTSGINLRVLPFQLILKFFRFRHILRKWIQLDKFEKKFVNVVSKMKSIKPFIKSLTDCAKPSVPCPTILLKALPAEISCYLHFNLESVLRIIRFATLAIKRSNLSFRLLLRFLKSTFKN
jgi:hypothetical protein